MLPDRPRNPSLPLLTSRRSVRSTWQESTRSRSSTFLENPTLAKGDQILAIPTLVRKLPEPVKKIIGDLSNTERVLVGLDLRPLDEQRGGTA